MHLTRHTIRHASYLLAATIGLSAVIVGTLPTPAHADASHATHAAANPAQVGVYRYRLGDFEITALSAGTVPQDAEKLLKGASKDVINKLLERSFQTNPVEGSINAFLIDTGTRLVLVDTGAGDLFGGAGGKLVARLKTAGYTPVQIDDVLLTHVHPDHSGGLVHDGQRVFPNALIHVGKPDVDFFLDPANQNGVKGYGKVYFKDATISLAPYEKSGQLRPFSGPTQILSGIRAIPAPGHTPGHSFYRVQSQGQSITFIGDMVNVAAVQFPRPDITSVYDKNPALAKTQRVTQIGLLTQERKLVAGAHLPFPGIGHIRSLDGGYEFVPVVFRDRDGN